MVTESIASTTSIAMEAPSAEPAIEVRGLTKYYGRQAAISDVAFKVMPGQVVGFLGPNGAGKSTTLRILCGLMPADAGVVKICGIPVGPNPRAVKRLIGYMPENNPLPETMRVREYLFHRAVLKEIPSEKRAQRVQAVMELCDLHRKTANKLIHALSKGFRQRVGIADALLSEPRVAILDEPTIGLDPHQILLIRELMETLRGKTAVIFSSHILAEVEKSCDQVIIINQGHVVATGAMPDLDREYGKHWRYRLRTKLPCEALREKLLERIPNSKLTPLAAEAGVAVPAYYWEVPVAESVPEGLLGELQRDEALHLQEFTGHPYSLEEIFLLATRRSWDEEMKGTRWRGKATE